jgi:hypothetical protein
MHGTRASARRRLARGSADWCFATNAITGGDANLAVGGPVADDPFRPEGSVPADAAGRSLSTASGVRPGRGGVIAMPRMRSQVATPTSRSEARSRTIPFAHEAGARVHAVGRSFSRR